MGAWLENRGVAAPLPAPPTLRESAPLCGALLLCVLLSAGAPRRCGRGGEFRRCPAPAGNGDDGSSGSSGLFNLDTACYGASGSGRTWMWLM